MRKIGGTGILRKAAARVARLPPVRLARRSLRTRDIWNMRVLEPASRSFGWDRGRPIDRYYIESFLRRHAGDVRGRVLEVGDRRYTELFGGSLDRSDVLDVSEHNRHATIVADLGSHGSLPEHTVDCIIVVQTLQFVFDLDAAVGNLHRALRPGGVVLATLPSISKVAAGEHDGAPDRWRFTPASVRDLFARHFPQERLDVEAHGNLLAACAFLHGIAVEEVDTAELDVGDLDYPVVVTARAVK